MKQLLFLMFALLSVLTANAKKENVIKIQVTPQEAAIYVDNVLMGNGYAEFTRPKKKNQVAIIRIECNEYTPIHYILNFMAVMNATLCHSILTKMDFTELQLRLG